MKVDIENALVKSRRILLSNPNEEQAENAESVLSWCIFNLRKKRATGPPEIIRSLVDLGIDAFDMGQSKTVKLPTKPEGPSVA